MSSDQSLPDGHGQLTTATQLSQATGTCDKSVREPAPVVGSAATVVEQSCGDPVRLSAKVVLRLAAWLTTRPHGRDSHRDDHPRGGVLAPRFRSSILVRDKVGAAIRRRVLRCIPLVTATLLDDANCVDHCRLRSARCGDPAVGVSPTSAARDPEADPGDLGRRPTVVYGPFALAFVQTIVLREGLHCRTDFSVLAAGLVMGVMIVPPSRR